MFAKVWLQNILKCGKYSPVKFANFVYFCIAFRNLFTFSPHNTKVCKICKLHLRKHCCGNKKLLPAKQKCFQTNCETFLLRKQFFLVCHMLQALVVATEKYNHECLQLNYMKPVVMNSLHKLFSAFVILIIQSLVFD